MCGDLIYDLELIIENRRDLKYVHLQNSSWSRAIIWSKAFCWNLWENPSCFLRGKKLYHPCKNDLRAVLLLNNWKIILQDITITDCANLPLVFSSKRIIW